MPTPFANEELSALLDGELTPDEAAELQRALDSDPALRAELETLEGVVSMVKTYAPAAAPAGFHERLMSRVETEHPQPGFWAWLRRPFGIPIEGLAVAAAVALVLLFVLPKATTPSGDVPADQANGKGLVADPAPAAPPAKVAGTDVADPYDAGDGVAAAEPASPKLVPPMPSPKADPAPVAAKDRGRDLDKPQAVIDDPLAPEGEGEAQAAAPPLAAPSGIDEDSELRAQWKYVVYSNAENPVWDLQRVAGNWRGEVRDANNRPVRDTRLTSNQANFKIHVPGDALPAFRKDLESVMIKMESTPTKDLTVGDMVTVDLLLNWVGGPVDDSRPNDAPASRKMKQLDEALDVEQSL